MNKCECGEPVPEDVFETELQALLNKHSKESGSNTADFILASYLKACLSTWDYHVRYRTDVNTMPALDSTTKEK